MLTVSRVIDECVLPVEIQWTLNHVMFEAIMVQISPVLPGTVISIIIIIPDL